MIYLGSLGRMIGIKCPASQNVQAEERYTPSVTLEGRRKMQARPVGRRTWSLQTSDATTPAEHSLLSQFADGAWGNGPFVFLPADALATNILTPEASLSAPGEYVLTSGVTVTEGAPLRTPDGWAARSLIKSTTNGLFLGKDLVPVPFAGKVTVAAYVRGSGGAAGVAFYDSAGGSLGTSYSSVTAGATNVVRSWVTVTPPVGAASCRVLVNSATQQTAWPSVTWTDKLQPFGEGQGCLKAVVSSMSRDQVLAVPGNTYSNVGFTVMEVG